MTDVHQYGNEHSAFIDVGVFIDRLNDYRLFKDPASLGQSLTRMPNLFFFLDKGPQPLL